MTGFACLIPVICFQLSYVNLIVLVCISCITGQTADRYHGRGAGFSLHWAQSARLRRLPLNKVQSQVANVGTVFHSHSFTRESICLR